MKKGLALILVLTAIASAAQSWTAQAWTSYLEQQGRGDIVDFSYAGYEYGVRPIPKAEAIATVLEFGAVANDGKDDTVAFQKALDTVGKNGGGVVYVPPGRYDFNVDGPEGYTQVVIKYDNVVLRGSGTSKTDSVLYLANKAIEGGYGSQLFTTEPKATKKKIVSIVKSAKQGDTKLVLAQTDWLKPGSLIKIELHNPMVGANERIRDDERLSGLYTPPKGLTRKDELDKTLKIRSDKLSRVITYPLEPEDCWRHYPRYAPVQYVTEVVKILKDGVVELAQPLHFEVDIEWDPTALSFDYLTGVGFENIRFESAWQGPYNHHGNWEMDYGWPALQLKQVHNGWMKNIVFENFTLDINVKSCKNATISDIEIIGLPGHNGIHVTGWDNMVTDCIVEASRTHCVGTGDSSIGNVYRNIKVTNRNGAIDLHGGNFPMKNLFEQIEYARITSGGASLNMPHSGIGNVFWNILAGTAPWKIKNELFNGYYNYWIGQRKERNDTWRTDCHKLYPGSIVVGIYDKEGAVEVDGSDKDKDDDFVYVEGLNKQGVYPASLYQAQYKLRMAENSK